MTKFKIQLFVILMGSILASGLQAMLPETVYRDNAIALRDMVFDKYKRGELSSVGTVKHAEVESITFEMLDRKNFGVYIKFPTMDVAKSEYSDEEWQAELSIFHRARSRWYAQRSINCGYPALARITDDETDVFGKNPGVYVSSSCASEKCAIEFSLIILHELAHTLDANLRRSEGEQDYSWLEEDVKNYSVGARIERSEWHADKQAISWLKDYKKGLIKIFEDRLALGYNRLGGYPPTSLLLAWLLDPNV